MVRPPVVVDTWWENSGDIPKSKAVIPGMFGDFL